MASSGFGIFTQSLIHNVKILLIYDIYKDITAAQNVSCSPETSRMVNALTDVKKQIPFNFSLISTISGEFIITHAPKHVRFLDGAGKIAASEVSKAVGLAMGFLPKKDIQWNGLAESNPFKRPRANVLIAIESPLKLNPKHVVSYPLENDEPFINMDLLGLAMQDLFVEKEPLIVDLASDNTMFDLKSRHDSLFQSLPATVEQAVDAIRLGSVLDSLSPGSLNVTQLHHRNLLAEIHVMFKILESTRAHAEIVNDGVPDLYSFGLSGLAHIVDVYGPASVEVRDAVSLVEKAVEQLTKEFRELYGDNVMVELVRMGPADRLAVRKARSLMEATVAPTPSSGDADKFNLAPVYSDMYPVIFNITLWLMVVFSLSVFAVSLGLWHMDPGRDSIIYRMTSQRIKKD